MTCLKDLTSVVDIKTSSRPAMIGSLTDGSTETFWESGDEDKNKTKSITISCVKGINASNVSVHVDNSRDIGVGRQFKIKNRHMNENQNCNVFLGIVKWISVYNFFCHIYRTK